MHSESTKLIAVQAQIYEKYASQTKFVENYLGEVKQKTYQTQYKKKISWSGVTLPELVSIILFTLSLSVFFAVPQGLLQLTLICYEYFIVCTF